MTGWLRSRAYDFWIGLKPSRFGLVTVLLLFLGFMEPWTGQGRDALQDYASSNFTLWDYLRGIFRLDFSSSDFRRHLLLFLATFCLAILTWFFCRLSGHFRFAAENDVLRRYRAEFPRAPFDRTDLAQQNAIADDADARVNNILGTRKWAPRILGILIPLVVAAAFLINVGTTAWLDVLIFLVIAVIVGAAVIGRRDFQNWLADWFSGRQKPWFGVFLQVGPAENAVTSWSEISAFAKAILCIVGVFVAISVVGALFWPLDFGRFFGPVPVIMLSLTVILSVGSLLAIRTRGSNFPWFTALVVLIAILSMASHHTMRFTADNVGTRLTPEALAKQFAEKQFAELPGAAPKPAILVATAGGGSRAAYWTATVLGELNKIPGFNDHLLLISGVSGGSLGALLYRAATLAAPDDPDKALAIAQEAAAGDFLSPLLSAMFTRDLVSLIPGLPDRAEVIENAWATSFKKACGEKLGSEKCPVELGHAFLKLWPRDRPPWPALVLNGTVVETGGRAVASSLDLHCKGGDAKATCGLVDVTDILAYQPLDLTASGAVNVSARFPVLGPSALTIVDDKCNERSVVDGGYFDNSGALTLQQVMNELAPVFNVKDENKDKRITPIVIQITSDPDFKWWNDNLRGRLDPGDAAPGGHQLVMPLRTYLGLRGSYGRQSMLGLKSLAERDGSYIHFDQCKNGVAGGEAPLAWVISGKTQQRLKNLLPDEKEALQPDAEQKEDSKGDTEAKGDSEAILDACRKNNAASFARVKACLKDLNSVECLGAEAEGQSPNIQPPTAPSSSESNSLASTKSGASRPSANLP
jgi:hypothetical protein